MNKNILALLLALGGMTQAVANTITVTTTADEDGTNSAACSLREAIKAAESNAAYGGCSAGGGRSDIIELAEATYNLLTALPEIHTSLTIRGPDTVDEDTTSQLTGGSTHSLPKATIARSATATSNFRLFLIRTEPADQYASMPSVALEGLNLSNGRAIATPTAEVEADRQGWGGAIYAEASLSLTNVQITNNRADGRGGAIFLGGEGTSLTVDIAQFSTNEAPQGAAISTASCAGQLFNSRSINVTNASFTQNGTTSDAGFVNTQGAALQVCGKTALKLKVSTLGENGNGTGAAIDADENNQAALELSSVTVVQNPGPALVVNPSTQTALSINNSIIAFNGTGDDCIPAARAANRTTNKLDPSCTDGSSTGQSIGTTTFAEVLFPLDTYGSLTKSYLPKMLGDAGAAATAAALLVDNGQSDATSCDSFDQRGVVHLVGAKCDIGSVERKQFIANEDVATNVAGTRLVKAAILANDFASEVVVGSVHTIRTLDNFTLTDGAPDVTNNNQNRCTKDTDNKTLIFDNRNNLVPTDAPIICKYKAIETGGAESLEVAVKFSVINYPPIAVSDEFTRPDGAGMTFNVLANDKDNDGAGVGGVTGIKITKFPELGTLYCISENNKKMYSDIRNNVEAGVDKCTGDGSLRYEPDNNLSPFTDKFEYVALDQPNAESNKATVTIRVDAPRPGTAGSWSLGGLAVLAMLGWRRRAAVTRV